MPQRKNTYCVTIPEELRDALKLLAPNVPVVRAIRFAAAIACIEHIEEGSNLTYEQARDWLNGNSFLGGGQTRNNLLVDA